jgi:hypothetical protein
MIFVVDLFVLFTSSLFAETDNLILARIGTRDGVATYHYGEFIQTRGKWIFPDVIYVDFGKNNYRETSIGGGIFLAPSKKLSMIQELSVVRATGSAANGATYLSPYFQLNYNFTSKILSETEYFPVFPLNKSGKIQHVLEHSKLEYDFKHFKIGGGYAAYKCVGDKWQQKPFVAATLKAGQLGEFEFWLQHGVESLPEFHVRYSRSFKTGRK